MMDDGVFTVLCSLFFISVVFALTRNLGKEKHSPEKVNGYRPREERYLKYVKIIADASEMFLDTIAIRYPKSVESVRDDLQELIREGYFPEHYIDWDDQKIVFSPELKDQAIKRKQSPPVQVKTTKESLPIQAKETDESPKVRSNVSKTSKKLGSVSNVVKCRNCGGITRLPDGKGDCDYCGSPLR